MAKETINSSKLALYIIPLLIVIAAILVTLTFVLPKLTEALTLKDELPHKKEQLSMLVQKRKLLESIGQGEVATFLTEADLALPTEKDPTSILVALENAAQLTSYTVDSVNFAPGIVSSQTAQRRSDLQAEVLHKEVPALAIGVSTRGTTPQFLDFLDTLFSSRRLFDLSSIEFNYVSKEEDFLSSNLTIYAFYQPEIKEVTDALSPLPEITASEKEFLRRLSSMKVISQTLLSGDTVSESLLKKSNLFVNE